MASTYLNDLRVEEQATGENSGTWGNKVNSAFSQIAEAFSYGTKQLAADSDETFTMPDGTSDGTRSLYLKITSAGSLTATRTVTLGPNTVSKLWIIENATTGSQSITIAQGSGGTVTIPTGAVKIVYSDGAGAGAAVVDALTDVYLASVDHAAFGDNKKAIFGAGSDLQIYHDGTSNIFAGNIVIDGSDASTSIASPAALNLKAGDANNEYSTLRLATSADGSLAMIGAKATTTGAYPNSVGQLELAVQNGASTNTVLTATSTGIDVTGTVTTDNLTIDGGASAFGATASDAYIMRADGTGTAPFDLAGSLVYQPRSTDSNGYGDHLFYTGSTQKLRQKIAADGDISFYEDTGTTAKLFWDASAESLGIGTAPAAGNTLDISSGDGTIRVTQELDVATAGLNLIGASNQGTLGRITIWQNATSAQGGYIKFDTCPTGTNTLTEAMIIDSSGDLNLVDSGLSSLNFTTDGSTDYARITGGKSGSGIGELQFWTYAGGISQAATIDQNGKLLVGKSASDYATEGVEIRSNEVLITKSTTNPLSVRNGTDGGLISFNSAGTGVGFIGAKSTVLTIGNNNTGGVIFGYSSGHTFIEPCDTAGASTDDLATLGSSTKRFRDLYLSGGAYIGGTAAANKLDDYEEGTFIPSIDIESGGTVSTSSSYGSYTKIGQQVIVHFGYSVTGTSGAGASYALQFGNIPFAAKSGAIEGYPITIRLQSASSAVYGWYGRLYGSLTTGRIEAYSTGGTALINSSSYIGSGTKIDITIAFETTS